MWGIMIVLSLIDGTASQFFSLSVIGVHVRLLIVIPMFFVCETLVVPRMSAFVGLAIKSGLVATSSLPALNKELSRVNKWKNAWLPELMFLLIAAILPLAESYFQPYAQLHPFSFDTGLSIASQWYLVVSRTVFRFLMLRWLWHLGLWCFMLWRISRLELNLLPTTSG